MKGILLAGGNGSRLWPMTKSISKQLIPIYDKPAIYYPLTTLLDQGIRDIAIISSPRDLPLIELLLGNGEEFGININYLVQEKPQGIGQAYLIARNFLEGEKSMMILGDNLFAGHNFSEFVVDEKVGARITAYKVSNPSDFGNITYSESGQINEIVEKPEIPRSNFAVTGAYFFDGTASERAINLEMSPRGEFEIVDLIKSYLEDNVLTCEEMPDGSAWLDMGTTDGTHQASEYVRIIQERQGLMVGSPHLVAVKKGWISLTDLKSEVAMHKSSYGASISKAISTL